MSRITINKIFVFCVLVTMLGCFKAQTKADQVCFKKTCYNVELALNKATWSQGLMHREHLDGGMLFIFPQTDTYSFWMKNTLIALDMIWIDHTQRVVHIKENVPPCKEDPCPKYYPNKEALYVLELNAGEVKKSGIKEYDRVDFNLNLKNF